MPFLHPRLPQTLLTHQNPTSPTTIQIQPFLHNPSTPPHRGLLRGRPPLLPLLRTTHPPQIPRMYIPTREEVIAGGVEEDVVVEERGGVDFEEKFGECDGIGGWVGALDAGNAFAGRGDRGGGGVGEGFVGVFIGGEGTGFGWTGLSGIAWGIMVRISVSGDGKRHRTQYWVVI